MTTPIATTQSNPAVTSSITKWMLAGSGVLFLVAMCTFLHLAYRRKAERAPSSEEGRVRPSPPRVHPPRTKVSLPASGVHRSHVCRKGSPSHKLVPSASSSMHAQAQILGNTAPSSGSGSEIDK
ncbi:hypothetical protein BGW80DRAFT_1253844 [Lactifluus volemus]|nr:hypothetical protein BGW80DRAFT_1253844 [Lactifluus volemus]